LKTIIKTFFLFILVFFTISTGLSGQDNLNNNDLSDFYSQSDQQRFIRNLGISQDEKISRLVNKHLRINKLNDGIRIWRIQLYSGHSLEMANNRKSELLSIKPELTGKCEVVSEPPNFKTVVGCFTDEIKEYKLRKELSETFPNCYSIRQILSISEISEKQK